MAANAQVEIALVASIADFKAQMGSAAKVLSDAVKQMGGSLDEVKGKNKEVEKSTGSLSAVMKGFAQEQRGQARVAKFYAQELASIIPVSKDSQAGLQGLLGVVVEGAAGGLSFGLAFEVAKFALDQFNKSQRETEEFAKRSAEALGKVADAAEEARIKLQGLKPEDQTKSDLVTINKLLADRARLVADVARAENPANFETNYAMAAALEEANKQLREFDERMKKAGMDLEKMRSSKGALLPQQQAVTQLSTAPALAALEQKYSAEEVRIRQDAENKKLDAVQTFGKDTENYRRAEIAIEQNLTEALLQHQEDRGKAHNDFMRSQRSIFVDAVQAIQLEGDATVAAKQIELRRASLDVDKERIRAEIVMAQEATAEKIRLYKAEEAAKILAYDRAEQKKNYDAEVAETVRVMGLLEQVDALRQFKYDAAKAGAYLATLDEEQKRLKEIDTLLRANLLTEKEAAQRRAEVTAAKDKNLKAPEVEDRVNKLRAELEDYRQNGTARLSILMEIVAAEESISEESDKRVIEAKRNLTRELNEQNKAAAEQAAATAEKIGSTLGQAFGDLATGARSLQQVMTGVLNDIVQMVIQAAIKQITASAYTAGANAASSQASVPIFGPVLALSAMGAMVAAVLGLIGGVGSAEQGWAIPKGLNPLVQAHGGEHVIPAKIAQRYEAGAPGGSSSGNTYQISINAVDSQSFEQALTRNATPLIKVVNRLARDRRW